MITTTEYKHIQLSDRGQAMIEGTTMKVIELIMSRIAYGWSAEEMHFQYPFLGMSQIHSALSYYWDNKTAMDAEINADFQNAEEMRIRAGETPFVARLKTLGLKQS
jgi:uncharacterized protein (DUF433 family)